MTSWTNVTGWWRMASSSKPPTVISPFEWHINPNPLTKHQFSTVFSALSLSKINGGCLTIFKFLKHPEDKTLRIAVILISNGLFSWLFRFFKGSETKKTQIQGYPSRSSKKFYCFNLWFRFWVCIHDRFEILTLNFVVSCW